MTTPDHTNAEVSDERLRELEGRYAIRSDPDSRDASSAITELLTRRSVTSQASEGEVAAYRYRDRANGPDERWIYLTPHSITEGPSTILSMVLGKPAEYECEPLYASPSKRVERLETGWLIEINSRSNGPTWFSMGETEDDGGHFTKDSLKALRFGRKEDAQAYIDDIGWTEAVPTEHEWVDGRQALGDRS